MVGPVFSGVGLLTIFQTKEVLMAKSALCPDCGERVPLTMPVRLGMRVTCPNCEAELEVVETEPIELDWVYEDDDYEYDDEFEYDEEEDEEDW